VSVTGMWSASAPSERRRISLHLEEIRLKLAPDRAKPAVARRRRAKAGDPKFHQLEPAGRVAATHRGASTRSVAGRLYRLGTLFACRAFSASCAFLRSSEPERAPTEVMQLATGTHVGARVGAELAVVIIFTGRTQSHMVATVP
jgi:hypothetical protein